MYKTSIGLPFQGTLLLTELDPLLSGFADHLWWVHYLLLCKGIVVRGGKLPWTPCNMNPTPRTSTPKTYQPRQNRGFGLGPGWQLA